MPLQGLDRGCVRHRGRWVYLETIAGNLRSVALSTTVALLWVIPTLTDGPLADSIGPWFGTGPDRGMALIFIVAGAIAVLVTISALGSRPYRGLSRRYAGASSEEPPPVVEEGVAGA